MSFLHMMESIKFNNINYVTLTHKQSDVELSTDNKKNIVNFFCYRFFRRKKMNGKKIKKKLYSRFGIAI